VTPPSRVAIIGTGLIGASLGLALRRPAKAPTVIGFDVDSRQARNAHGVRAIDRVADDLRETVQGADLVVIATPVRAVEGILREIGNVLSEGTLVTDTASTKAEVIGWAARLLPPRVAFVGGHPMAGKMTAQVDGPHHSLFTGATYCLTPDSGADPDAVERAVWLVEAVGAVPYFLDPDEHDALVAAVSHLPYLVSTTLMQHLGSDRAWREMSALAAGGLLSATALADGDPRMFADICLTNRAHVADVLERYIGALEAVRAEVRAGDEALLARFQSARDLHAAWLESRTRKQAGYEEEELRPPNPLLPGRWQRMLRGKRPER
jgi:prephenate dehydrogenase